MRTIAFQRAFGCLGLALGLAYLSWRVSSTINPAIIWISTILLVAECVDMTNYFFLLLSTWKVPSLNPPAGGREALESMHAKPTVDVMIPTYNEERHILEATLEGCLALQYPVQVYILDDGRRDWVKEMCDELGVGYITRPNNTHQKAGNINHALPLTRGEYILFLDADFVPRPQIVENALSYFVKEPKLAIVQYPQSFYNLDALETTQRRDGTSWWEQDFYYFCLLAYRTAWNTAHWCGTPAVVRRAALEDVGNVAIGSSVEDYQTSLRLVRRGWSIRFAPFRLGYGVAPHTLDSLLVQRLRWCEGNSQVLISKDSPLRGRGLSLVQRLTFFAGHYYYLTAINRTFYNVLPVVLFYFSQGHLPVLAEFQAFFPLWIAAFVTQRLYTNARTRGTFSYFRNDTLAILMAHHLPFAAIRGLLPFKIRFRVTPKSGPTDPGIGKIFRDAPFLVFLFTFYLITLGVAGAQISQAGRLPEHLGFFLFGAAWMIYNITVLATAFVRYGRIHRRGLAYRFVVNLPSVLSGEARNTRAVLENLNQFGAALTVGSRKAFQKGQEVSISVRFGNENVKLNGKVTWIGRRKKRLGMRFERNTMENQRKLLWFLYVHRLGSGNAVQPMRTIRPAERNPGKLAASIAFLVLLSKAAAMGVAGVVAAGSPSLANESQVDEDYAPLHRAYEKLNAGKVREAEVAFRRLLNDPRMKKDALEGMAWVRVHEQRFGEASQFADQRIAYEENRIESAWYPKYLEIQRLNPNRRPQAIRLYRDYLKSGNRSKEVYETFADFLTWKPETFKESIKVYQAIIANKQWDGPETRTRLARVLLNGGKAEIALRQITYGHPRVRTQVSYLALAQAYHWTGKQVSALKVVDEGLGKYPNDPELLKERSALVSEIKPGLAPSAGRMAVLTGYTTHLVFGTVQESSTFFRMSEGALLVKDGEKLTFTLFGGTDQIKGDTLGRGLNRFHFDSGLIYRPSELIELRGNLGHSFLVDGAGRLSFKLESQFRWGSALQFAISPFVQQHSLLDQSGANELDVGANSEGSTGQDLRSIQNQTYVRTFGLNGSVSYRNTFAFLGYSTGETIIAIPGSESQIGRNLLLAGAGHSVFPFLTLQFGFFNLTQERQSVHYYSVPSLTGYGPKVVYQQALFEKLRVLAQLGYQKLTESGNSGTNYGLGLKYKATDRLNLLGSFTNQKDLFYEKSVFGISMNYAF